MVKTSLVPCKIQGKLLSQARTRQYIIYLEC
jgi:hypothetical protein